MRQNTLFTYDRLSQLLRPQSKTRPNSVSGRASGKHQYADERIQTRPSIALTKLFQRLSDQAVTRTEDIHILDLGPARQNILELAARLPYKLHIADVIAAADLSAARAPEGENHLLSIDDWCGLLPVRPKGGFLAVLCWDIFNYLDIEEIKSLASYLNGICADGARIHSISYTSVSMPTRPLNYELLTPATLYRRHHASDTVTAPRYGANVIADSMSGFHIEHLYQHGSDALEELYQFNAPQ